MGNPELPPYGSRTPAQGAPKFRSPPPSAPAQPAHVSNALGFETDLAVGFEKLCIEAGHAAQGDAAMTRAILRAILGDRQKVENFIRIHLRRFPQAGWETVRDKLAARAQARFPPAKPRHG